MDFANTEPEAAGSRHFWVGASLRVLALARAICIAAAWPSLVRIAALGCVAASQVASANPSASESSSEPAQNSAPVAASNDNAAKESTPPTGPPTRPYSSSEEFAIQAMKLREAALSSIEPRTSLPTSSRTAAGAYRWKTDIVTTTFWVKKNSASSWDPKWGERFGGFDNPEPEARLRGPTEYRAAAFIPQQNPFYCSLPYNDVTATGSKPESKTVIPWFRAVFVKDGQSVCRDRWIAVRNRRNNRIAYCQWSDCGPYRSDHYQYVFGNERPLPNRAGGAALGISPSVRDYLGAENTDITDWRFVEAREIPPGPWRKYGANNPFISPAATPATSKAPPVQPGPSNPQLIIR